MKLQISRGNTYNDKVRKYKIYINDQFVGELGNDESKSFEVAEGTYKLQAKIDWCTSNPITFNVATGQDVSFYVVNSASGLKRLLAVFYITIWKNKYLTLTQTS